MDMNMWLSNTSSLNPTFPAVSAPYFEPTFMPHEEELGRDPYYARSQEARHGHFRGR